MSQAINFSPTPTITSTLRTPSDNRLLREKLTIKTYKSQQIPAVLNTLNDIINKYVDPPTHSSGDPRVAFAHNFAPVDELPPTECDIIEGVLPSCLNGAYIRNGPNPQFFPRGPYHLFDGDGMLHCVRISNGKAALCSRYVKTYKYMIEQEVGTSIIPNFFSGFNGFAGFAARVTLALARMIAGQYHPHNGVGLANTSLALFSGRLYALAETDVPYEIRLTPNGDIQTIGRNDFDGKLVMNMTAHPKVDQDTGETFAFRYGLAPPYLTYFRFDPEGNKQQDVSISSFARPPFLHDFAVTKKYAIFPDIQIEMDPLNMMFRGGPPLNFNPSKVSRIGVIPRYADNGKDIRWFDVPLCNIIHVINAWDDVDVDGNEVIIIIAPNINSAEHFIDRMEKIHSVVEKVRIDLKTGVVTRQPLSDRNLDLGVINPAYLGKKNKYVYIAMGEPAPKVKGIVKIDFSMAEDQHRDCVVASRMFGPGCNGGEPFFVASDPDNPEADEDEGYIVSYVHDENSGESTFVVMDAKSPTLDIVASVRLPQRVPYGFHGLFVREQDLNML